MIHEIAAEYARQANEPHPIGEAVRKIFGKEPRKRLANVSLNHTKDNVREIVGKVSELEVHDHEGTPILLAKMNILKEDNIKNVRLGLWSDISLSFVRNQVSGKTTIREISYVFDPAVDWAGTLAEVNFSSGKAKNNATSYELSSCVSKLEHLRLEKDRLESELQRVQGLKKVGYSLHKMVEDGLISLAQCKVLKQDAQEIDLASHGAFVRAIKTIAKSKKVARGQVNYNFSLTAMENLVDNLYRHTGGKMAEKATVTDLAKLIAENIKTGKKDFDLAAKEHLKKEINKEEKHVENDHTPRFSSEDYSRLCQMGEKKDLGGMMDFLKNIGHDYGFTKEKEKEKEEETAGADMGSHTDEKLKEQEIELSQLLKENIESTNRLEKTLIELASGKAVKTEELSNNEEGK
jgi:hypothetical protein